MDQNKGKLTAYQEQLTQVFNQMDEIELALAQLDEADGIFKEFEGLLNQLEYLEESEQLEALEDLKSLLQLLAKQLPNASELQGLIDVMIEGLTLENIATINDEMKTLQTLLSSQRQEIEQQLQGLEQQRAELEAGLQAIEAGQRQLDEGRQDLGAAQQQLREGRKQLTSGREAFLIERERGQQKLDATEKELKAARATFDKEFKAFEKLKKRKFQNWKKRKQH
ncbi:hypothetical protein ACFQOY_00975 [Enterococcus alcedinis]|uniref:hypothetical protein n=1 Tax=Enterococcus alcedinis TaxID=1274384 RepID=UPI003609E2BF